VDDLRDHGEGLHGASADARHKQELCEVGRPAVCGSSQSAVQAPEDHVLRPHIMMRRHDKMRKERLVRLATASFQS
jgi:hypothetical protein